MPKAKHRKIGKLGKASGGRFGSSKGAKERGGLRGRYRLG